MTEAGQEGYVCHCSGFQWLGHVRAKIRTPTSLASESANLKGRHFSLPWLARPWQACLGSPVRSRKVCVIILDLPVLRLLR